MKRSLNDAGIVALFGSVALVAILLSPSFAQEERPAFVVIERTATSGAESIQEEYGRLARDILPKYGARYLARSQRNVLFEGDGGAPCCMAILQFPDMDTARRWFDSPENREAAKVRQSGAKFRIVAMEGLPAPK
ncbi:DUF1330 domain-containing protein [Bradyrhizobium sp. GCM10027634]|uniref:DUF1330 domain-containing protein n=1 Tax=unclassified Bradyrhizobium TaxID=2631580 RepID=UPI00188D157B|nr:MULTISPECIES: DUF1330 domain-containing protein [unclassified Bradyrhizobium]MDN5004737.1 DUF1330 domain-containing protein [Bradyrhizobium sp. WYCCWR 12677]QOZ45321.1 hypothetical protein XH89_18935 [Bradyrhizobium sp. CCBAU 53340]